MPFHRHIIFTAALIAAVLATAPPNTARPYMRSNGPGSALLESGGRWAVIVTANVDPLPEHIGVAVSQALNR